MNMSNLNFVYLLHRVPIVNHDDDQRCPTNSSSFTYVGVDSIFRTQICCSWQDVRERAEFGSHKESIEIRSDTVCEGLDMTLLHLNRSLMSGDIWCWSIVVFHFNPFNVYESQYFAAQRANLYSFKCVDIHLRTGWHYHEINSGSPYIHYGSQRCCTWAANIFLNPSRRIKVEQSTEQEGRKGAGSTAWSWAHGWWHQGCKGSEHVVERCCRDNKFRCCRSRTGQQVRERKIICVVSTHTGCSGDSNYEHFRVCVWYLWTYSEEFGTTWVNEHRHKICTSLPKWVWVRRRCT